MEKYIVAVEPGSSKIRAALATVSPDGAVTVKAIEEEPLTDSVSHGLVFNVAQTAASIRNVLTRLEKSQGGGRVTGVYVALGGRSMQAAPVRVERRLTADTLVGDEHLMALEREARTTVLPDRDIVDVTPREYFIDNQRTATPAGSIANEIRATFNLVSCRSQLRRNLTHVFDHTALTLPLRGFVVRQLAEADMVLTPAEKRMGCMLVDFGAETTTVSIYRQGVLVYLATLPLGSRNITRDMTTVLHLEEDAEKAKLAGNANGTDMPDVGEVLSARVGEIIANINEQVKYADLTPADLPGGIVLVGGGARLRGFNQRLEQTSKMKVRVGQPSQAVRIADASASGSDALDIIAVVAAAAANPAAVSCFEEFVETISPNDELRHETPAEPEPEPEPEEEIPTIGGRGKRAKSGPSFAQRLAERFSKLISEAEDDEDMRDD